MKVARHNRDPRRSKLLDHRRRGRCGWVGDNPRYSDFGPSQRRELPEHQRLAARRENFAFFD
jgi:hypothetical protein